MITTDLIDTIVRGTRIAFDLDSQTTGDYATWLAAARTNKPNPDEWFLTEPEPRTGLVWSLHSILCRALNSADHPFAELEPSDQDALLTAMRAISGIIELDLAGVYRGEVFAV